MEGFVILAAGRIIDDEPLHVESGYGAFVEEISHRPDTCSRMAVNYGCVHSVRNMPLDQSLHVVEAHSRMAKVIALPATGNSKAAGVRYRRP